MLRLMSLKVPVSAFDVIALCPNFDPGMIKVYEKFIF
jgi:hypothetical protein